LLRGVFPPLVTPFREDGGLDLAAFERNLAFYAEADLAGCLVLGSNGEAGSLDPDEKVALIRAARKGVPGRTLLVGTGLDSTRATIELTRRSADLGADAALVLTPSYYKPQMTLDALRRHFEAVADASPIPVLLYSVPQFTGLPFPLPLARTMAAHQGIAGMKESSGDMGLLGRIVSTVPETYAVLCGSAPVLYAALCLGAAGGVVAVACCAPGPVAALYRAHEAGDHARARRLQDALTPLATAVTATHGVAGLKAAMNLAGLAGGHVRAPLLPAPADIGVQLRPLFERAQATV
jgi:4-hydroxy-tetrahydrodipicolinate synthase